MLVDVFTSRGQYPVYFVFTDYVMSGNLNNLSFLLNKKEGFPESWGRATMGVGRVLPPP